MIEHLLGHDREHHSHQLGLATSVVALGLALTACGGAPTTLGDDDASPPDYLTPSAVYLQSGVDRAAAAERLDSLRAGIDRLRKQSKSSWIGRQDDVTGYLTELAGGRYQSENEQDADAVTTALMDIHGPKLFGITSTDLELGDPLTTKGVPTATIRGAQAIRGVPVRDGELVFTLADPDTQPVMTSVRGRVFNGLDVATTPRTTAENAERTAERISKGTATAKPTLVVLPTGAGVLAWQVSINAAQPDKKMPAQNALYYIDAVTGELVDTRASSTDAAPGQASVGTSESARDDGSVKVTGKGPLGNKLTANGVRTPDGIGLYDTTVPTYDPETGEGGIGIYDARGRDEGDFSLYEQKGAGTKITDPEAIGALAYSREVYDYFDEQFGWQSWNDDGATLQVIVNFGDGSECNAYSSGGTLTFHAPCRTDQGFWQPVDLEIVGHETTHSVVTAKSDLIYTGESGALNESFADYFGNVVGNLARNKDDSHLGEDSCAKMRGPDEFGLCRETSDGKLAGRHLLTGNTLADYLRLLTYPYKLRILNPNNPYGQDAGGVHLNSSIWNNALWTIRNRVAQLDGTTMLRSQLVKTFDQIVFSTMIGLSPTSGFLDARNLLEQTIRAVPDSGSIATIARQVLDENKICGECVEGVGIRGNVIASGGASQIKPAVNRARTVWLESGGETGRPHGATTGGTPAQIAEKFDTYDIDLMGRSVVALEQRDGQIHVVRYSANGRKTDLAKTSSMSVVFSGLDGSEEGAAWFVDDEETAYFSNPKGVVREVRISDLQKRGKGDQETVTAVSTGGGTVGMGTSYGRILLWKPGGAPVEVGQTNGRILVTATHGGRVLAINSKKKAQLFERGEDTVAVSTRAAPYGATMNARYAIWAEEGQVLGGGVARSEGASFYDTNLMLYSSATNKKFKLLDQRGQQGFPSLSGSTLVWQDTSHGGDDIRSGEVPGDL